MKDSIYFYCLMMFAFIGLITSINIVHEYTHMFEFNKLDKINDNLCALNLPTLNNLKDYTAIGTYEFSFKGQKELYNKLDKNSELKAYLFSLFPLIFFMICWCIVIYRRFIPYEN